MYLLLASVMKQLRVRQADTQAHHLAKTINWRGQISENVKPWDLINGTPRATKEEAERRFDICKACPELVELTSTCKQCGCFMYMKTKLQPATCPLGKW
jgi:hypothetical protein